jgi:hypothetical protein
VVQFILILAGAACLVIALAFGLAGQTVEVRSYSRDGTFSGSAPGPAAQGAACGFAIAGGLCLLGAAVVKRNADLDTSRKQAALICELEAQVANLHDEPPQG